MRSVMQVNRAEQRLHFDISCHIRFHYTEACDNIRSSEHYIRRIDDRRISNSNIRRFIYFLNSNYRCILMFLCQLFFLFRMARH